MRKLIRSIKNWFTDKPQEQEPIFKPLPKIKIEPANDAKKAQELKTINFPLFIREIEIQIGLLSQSQRQGFKAIMLRWEVENLPDIRWLAYILATAWHETAYTMQPIVERGSEAYLISKKYWPYIGRGYVQITWRHNYEKYGIADQPDRALEPDLAAHILIDGMSKGVFTGKKLFDYFNHQKNDPVNARRIINGTDKAMKIAEHHERILIALYLSQLSEPIDLGEIG